MLLKSENAFFEFRGAEQPLRSVPKGLFQAIGRMGDSVDEEGRNKHFYDSTVRRGGPENLVDAFFDIFV